MADYDLLQDVNYGQKPKEAKETEGDALDHGSVAKAVEHGRPDALGNAGAMHLQRMAGNAAMGALVQRKAGGEEQEQSPGGQVHDVIGKGGGSALPESTRSAMESSMGHDFSDVKVHTGSQAAGAASSVQAQAFTVGNEIVFNEGKYNPGSAEGDRTIAHELTHVVQQRNGAVDGESRGGGIKVSTPDDRFEQQAEATADAVMSGGGDHAGHDHGAGAGGVQREAEDDVAQMLPIQRAPEEDEAPEQQDEGALQPLRDEQAVQRAEAPAEDEATEDESVSKLHDDTVQREDDDETPDE
jgi:hypothetical protein